jgi:hypothetical protein
LDNHHGIRIQSVDASPVRTGVEYSLFVTSWANAWEWPGVGQFQLLTALEAPKQLADFESSGSGEGWRLDLAAEAQGVRRQPARSLKT